MPLTNDDIRKLADLARLEIAAGEVADVSAKLSAIVGLVDELKSVATAGVTPSVTREVETSPGEHWIPLSRAVAAASSR